MSGFYIIAECFKEIMIMQYLKYFTYSINSVIINKIANRYSITEDKNLF